MSSHYETLGVNENCSADDLKIAFRKLAKQHHPDMGGDATKFQQINEAYTTLNDPNARAHYDHQRRNPQPQFHQFHHHGGNPFEFNFAFNAGDPFPNIHDQIFQHFGFANRQPARNRNIRVNLEMDFLETLRPVSKVIEFKTSNNNEKIQIDVPAGIEDGMVFTIQGRGDDANVAIPRGNLEVSIRVRPHPRFLRNGENIMEDLTINCFQAILGHTLQIMLPSGKTIDLHIPAGTQHQSQFGITDEGFPKGNGMVGKYIAKINVLIPTALTQEQLDLVKEILKNKPINA